MASGKCLDPDQEAGRPVQSSLAGRPTEPGGQPGVDSLSQVAAVPDRRHRLLPGRCRSLDSKND
eukprot:315029-Hanusia_phi.AAC.1